MITPSEFVSRWKEIWREEFIKFSADILENIDIDEDVKRFLMEAGLPDSAAPELTFAEGLPSICEQYGQPEEYNNYKYIGFTGFGDPICLNENDGSIVHLDHEEDFEYETFINSSIPQLAESLLTYAQFVKETQKENGDDAFLNNNIPDRLKKWITKEFERIDPQILEGGFWLTELENLDEEEFYE